MLFHCLFDCVTIVNWIVSMVRVALMNQEHFMICLKYNNQTRYYLYYFLEFAAKDYLVLDGDRVLTFSDVDALRAYVRIHHIELSEQDPLPTYDIDRLALLCSQPMSDFDCNEIIQVWNLTDAICNALKLPFIGNLPQYDDLYDKLFGGCNTAVNTHEYHPQWTKSEAIKIRTVLDECLRIIQKITH